MQQGLHNCTTRIEKQRISRLIQMKPLLPVLNTQLKIHKANMPIMPIVNNISAPSYKVPKFLSKELQTQLWFQRFYYIQFSISVT